MEKRRYLQSSIAQDLSKGKMVFVGGPRQVGKTTLAQLLGRVRYRHPLYLVFDDRQDRIRIIGQDFPEDTDLIIFDELHKYRHWKSYLKGLYDKRKKDFHIIVTGSARLDVYRRGGDSMMGRYYYYRLHPFSLAEAVDRRPRIAAFKQLVIPEENKTYGHTLDALLHFGGFPEAYLAQDDTTTERFHTMRIDRVIKEDIRDLERIPDLSALQVLVTLLPEKVGSLLSLNALRKDLEVSHKALAHWVDILERFYYLYRIAPYQAKTIRALKKEPKLYLWDWSEVQNESARFENLIASHLLKFIHFFHDTQGKRAELYFIRDVDGHETDFLITIDRKPWFAVEVKLNDMTPSKHIRYFSERLGIPFLYQVVRSPGVYVRRGEVLVVSADRFLASLV